MKTLILSLALAALVAPCAMADVGGVANTAVAGAVGNLQVGNHNRASNDLNVRQKAFTGGSVGRRVVPLDVPGLDHPDCQAPAACPLEPLRRIGAPDPETTLTSLFGNGPLVNNNIAVGTAVNIQNGNGNTAGNGLSFGQSISAPSLGGMGGVGSLVNNNIAVGTTVNVQNGNHNSAFNDLDLNQKIGGLGGRREVALPAFAPN